MLHRLWAFAFVAGAVLSWVSLGGSKGEVPPLWEDPAELDVQRFELAHDVTPIYEAAFAAPVPMTIRPSVDALGQHRFRVRAVDRDEPVVGAKLFIVRETAVARALGIRATSDVLSLAETDLRGFAALDASDVTKPSWLLVSARGYVPQELQLDTLEQETAISLEQGFTLSGIVETGATPATDVWVQAVPVGLPFYSAYRDLLVREHYRSRVAPDGRFAISGLARGHYRVHVVGDGWLQRDGGNPLSRCPAPHELVHIARDAAIRLSADPVRCFRLALWCRASDQPFAVGLFPVTVTETPGVQWSYQRDPVDVCTAVGAVRTGAHVTGSPWVYCGLVRLAPGAPVPDKARIAISSGGIQYGFAEVRLQLPSDLISARRADKILLDTLPPSKTAELRLQAEGQHDRAPVLTLESAAMRVVRFGVATTQGMWRFTDLPPGEYRAALTLGRERAAEFPIVVEPGQQTELRPAWRTLPGAIVHAQAPNGHRLWDATIGLVPVKSPEAGIVVLGHNLTDWASPLDRDGALRQASKIVASPGRYRAWISMPGYQDVQGEIEVLEGNTATMSPVLRPAEAADR